ncbi:MAG: flagellar basal body-associated FliL family protein [Pseudomonadota bacterium]
MKKLLPLILLLIGAGAGVGAGVFLRPAPEPVPEAATEEASKEQKKKAKTKEEEASADYEYMKLSNQFVVPIVKKERVSALIVLSLSIEVMAGNKEKIYLKEPKLRDSFLRILFDHANVGGFDGEFTDANNLDILRRALLEIAQRDLGDVIADVLILDIARQDY